MSKTLMSEREWPELAGPATPPTGPQPPRYGAAAGIATASMGFLLAGLLFALVGRYQGDGGDTDLGLAIAVAAFVTAGVAATVHQRQNRP